MDQKFLTAEEISHELGLGRTTTYQLIKPLNHIKVGRRILVPREELMEYLRKHTNYQADSNTTLNHKTNFQGETL